MKAASTLFFILLVAGACGLAFFGNAYLVSHVPEYFNRVLAMAGINAILAIGLNLIFGTAGQFTLGYAGFVAVGAYGAAISIVSMEHAFHIHHPLIFNGGLLIGALLAGLSGLVVAVPCLRVQGDYLAMVTLGFGEIIRLVFNNVPWWGGARGFSGPNPVGLYLYTDLFYVYAWLVVVIALMIRLTKSSYGRTLLAVAQDELAASTCGVSLANYKISAFVISSAVAGLGGGLFAHLQSTIRPDDFRLERSIDVMLMVLLGGLGNVWGAALGGFAVTVLLEMLRPVQHYRMAVYAVLLIAFMVWRPKGLMGHVHRT